MATQIYAPVTVLDATTSAAVSGTTFLLDYRFAPGVQQFSYVGSKVSGDTVECKVSPDGSVWEKAVYTTASFSDVISGPQKYIKWNKTGAFGAAKVVAMLPGASKVNPTGV